MDKFVSNGELSLRHYVINKYLRPQYPKIELVMLEEEDVTSESDSGSDDEDNEEDNKDKMDIDDEKGNTKESKETEANKHKENDEMEVDDSKKDEKPTEQSTKERTDNSDEESVLASNKTRNNNKDSSPKDNEVQLEDNPIYMDLHLNIPETKENTGPMAAIETLSKKLHNWLQGLQEMDGSFKLHSVDPSHSSQKVLHNLDDFPTTKYERTKRILQRCPTHRTRRESIHENQSLIQIGRSRTSRKCPLVS